MTRVREWKPGTLLVDAAGAHVEPIEPHSTAEEEALLDSIAESNRHADRMRKHGEQYVADLQAGRICWGCGSRDVVASGQCERCAVVAERGREWGATA